MTTYIGKSDPLFKNLLKNALTVLSGDAVSSILQLAALLLTARALGVQDFGVLVYLQTMVLVVDRLVNSQSWLATIRYGTEALHAGDDARFKRAIKVGAVVDISTASVGALVAMVVTAAYYADDQYSASFRAAACFYSLTVLSNISGTPTAIFRTFNAYRSASKVVAAGAAVKLLIVSALYFSDASLTTFVVGFIVAEVAKQLMLAFFAWREIARQGYGDFWRQPLRGTTQAFPGIWAFLLTTNASGSVRMISRELDTLLVGTLLGETAVGLYKVAKQYASVLAKGVDPMHQAIYPELARLWAAQDWRRFRFLVFKGAVLAGALGLAFLLLVIFAGGWLLRHSVGEDFVGAQDVFTVYTCAIFISALVFPVQPAALAMGLHRESLAVLVVSTGVYLVALVPLCSHMGMVGAGLAYMLFFVVWASALGIPVFRKVHALSTETGGSFKASTAESGAGPLGESK